MTFHLGYSVFLSELLSDLLEYDSMQEQMLMLRQKNRLLGICEDTASW